MNIKKLLAIICGGLTFTLTSCGKTECSYVKLSDDLSFHSKIVEDKNEYEADFKRMDSTGWKVVFKSPETVKGMEIDLFKDSVTLNFKGLTYTTKRTDIPQFNMVSLITSAVDNCISGKVKCEKSGDKVTEKGSVGQQNFSALLEKDKLKSIEISDILKAEIS